MSAAKDKAGALTIQLEGEKKLSARALAQVEVLNQQTPAMRRQLAALEEALNASEQKDKEAQNQMSDLGQRLNLALAERVKELSRYRSDFFGKLREILGNRPDMRIVGDRFVLQSEVFFDSGKADLKPAGDAELDKVAEALVELEGKIPTDIPWVLRVDGHTDVRPISAAAAYFRSNWDLSAARAIAVVKYLIAKGVSPRTADGRRLRRIPADRHRQQRGGLPPQPPHRVQADGAVGPKIVIAGLVPAISLR